MDTIPFFLFLAAFIIRVAAALFWQFDGLYGQDTFAYLQQAQAITAVLPNGQLPPTDFFWPNGFPALIAATAITGGSSALRGQIVVLFCGAMMSPLVYWLSKAVLPPPQNQLAGILAGLIVAVAGQPILSSIVIMADMPALFWATLSAWCLVQAINPAKPQQQALLLFAAAGATLALALVTRWVYMLIVPTFMLYALFCMRKNKQPWWPPFPAVVSGFLILVPQLWISWHRPETVFHSWLLGWQPANFFQRQFETIDGFLAYPLPVGIYYAQPAGHPAYIFPLLGITALWGVWQLYRSQEWEALILLVGWAGSVYLFLAGIPYQNFRFGLTIVIPLVILTGFGTSHIWHYATTRSRPTFKYGVAAILAFSLVGMLAWAYPMLDSFLTAQNHSKYIAHQVEQTLPPQTTVLTFGLTLTLQHYTNLHAIELFHQDQAALKRLVAEAAPTYLLLDTHNVETQWQGKIPQLHYAWLQKNTHLTVINTIPPFTLYKINEQ